MIYTCISDVDDQNEIHTGDIYKNFDFGFQTFEFYEHSSKNL